MSILIFFIVICSILVLIAVILLFGLSMYNGLIRLKILVQEAWSGIDVQLKKRYDLIPNLVSTVKGYAGHESDVFEKVAELRSVAMKTTDINEKVNVENQLSGTLKTLFAVSENYPQLKADQSFLNLQNQLANIETDLESARRYYNGTVREFNTKILVFPSSIIAGMLKYSTQPFFEAEPDAKANVKVDFSN